jgi:glycosyltransferase involved in cell wall biosynthesis
MKPLISILIPAHNAEDSITYTIRSAVDQTWPNKEIIVVNDGSTDRTGDLAASFASKNVKVVSTENQGLSSAINHAYSLCQGDYIQELDSDDLLAPDKIEKQLATLHEGDSKRLLLSCPWAYFYYRTSRAKFVRSSLWQDLLPVEWLLRKMNDNVHMQNATWLVSRELAEAAGPWDATLRYDQDGEYFSRVLLASEGTRFVPEARIFYRSRGTDRISYIGSSNVKRDSLFRSMRLHMQYLHSLEDSERVRKVCVKYMQAWYGVFYPERPDIMEELQCLAKAFGGTLKVPQMRWRYAWIKSVFGWKAAKMAQTILSQGRDSLKRNWDKMMFERESSEASR